MKKRPLYSHYGDRIIEMVSADQKMREQNLRGAGWDEFLDKRNTAHMRNIVALIGWPSARKVGLEASRGASLLVRHADHDVAFQQVCLEFMKCLQFLSGEGIVPVDIAYLEDRVRVNTGRLQLYGTQFDEVDGDFVPKPIYDPDNVDQRRREVGLDSLEGNIRRMREKYRMSEK